MIDRLAEIGASFILAAQDFADRYPVAAVCILLLVSVILVGSLESADLPCK